MVTVTSSVRQQIKRLWTTPQASVPFCFCRRWEGKDGSDPCSPTLSQNQILACAPSSSKRGQGNAATSSPMACEMPSDAGLLLWEGRVSASGTGRSSMPGPSERQPKKGLMKTILPC